MERFREAASAELHTQVTPRLLIVEIGSTAPHTPAGARAATVRVHPGDSGTLHVEVTSTLFGRVMQHRAASFGGSSQRCCSARLIYFEVADDMPAAIARERQVKRDGRDWKLNLSSATIRDGMIARSVSGWSHC